MNKDELKIVQKLKELGETVTPKKSSLEKMLQNIDNEDVTKTDYPRYSYSMNWKFAAPIFLAVLLLVGFFALKNPQKNVIQPRNQTEIPQAVTAQNTDETLSQTDVALNQSMDQLDKDLKAVDATNNQEEDPNNL